MTKGALACFTGIVYVNWHMAYTMVSGVLQVHVRAYCARLQSGSSRSGLQTLPVL